MKDIIIQKKMIQNVLKKYLIVMKLVILVLKMEMELNINVKLVNLDMKNMIIIVLNVI